MSHSKGMWIAYSHHKLNVPVDKSENHEHHQSHATALKSLTFWQWTQALAAFFFRWGTFCCCVVDVGDMLAVFFWSELAFVAIDSLLL